MEEQAILPWFRLSLSKLHILLSKGLTSPPPQAKLVEPSPLAAEAAA